MSIDQRNQTEGRIIGLVAMGVPVWFLAVYLIMSGMRPDFSHLHKAVSELGSLDAPNLWAWNILGYMIPGFVVSILGFGLLRRLRGQRFAALASWGLIISGAFFSLSGMFPGDFENRRSVTMTMHTLGSLSSFVAFLLPAFVYPIAMHRLPTWRIFTWPSLMLVLLMIGSGFARSGSMPGVGQRVGFAFFFLWVGLMGYALFRDTWCDVKPEVGNANASGP